MSGKSMKLRFTPKPGKYPPHKGGQTWLHEPGGARKVKHGDRGTTKVYPKVVIGKGDEHNFPLPTAKTLLKRYECWEKVETAAPAVPKSTKGDDA